MTAVGPAPAGPDPDRVALGSAALLAGLPGLGPSGLRRLLDEHDPATAWARATSGDAGGLLGREGGAEGGAERAARWARQRHRDPLEVADAHDEAGVAVLLRTDPRYPDRLRDDPASPAVLFVAGALPLPWGPAVAIVGTRRCTGVGAGFARELGEELASVGVTVVSGLALGIDGAAHRGALDAVASARTGVAAPVGVVGSGLDVVYPARHRALWAAVAATGSLCSEAPLGVRPAAWRFPARNRVLAALADVVVVVESHAAGGSLHTVDEALARDVPVLVAPGSVRNPAAAGTNRLLAEGCHPVRDTTDVLVALGLSGAGAARPDPRPAPSEEGARLLDAFDWEPATLDQLVVRSGLGVAAVAVHLDELVEGGWVAPDGPWYERVAP